MRSLIGPFVILFGLATTASLAQESSSPSTNQKDASSSPSESEVRDLREEVVAQRRLIEALRLAVDQLTQGTDAARDKTDKSKEAAAIVGNSGQKHTDPAPVTAGWNGEHFFLKSPDGQFQAQPVGYLNTSYTFYKGDGAPPDTFAIKRARFGVQGNYGAQVDYVFLFDSAATNGVSIRDAYLDFQPFSALKFQGGQFKEPFSQEVGTGDTNVEFLERSIVSVLYPSAAGSFRAPGVEVHGDIDGGVAQYWVGAFNGKGIIANNTTNEPEVVGRLRFYPWRKNQESLVHGLAFGGSIGHGRSRGLSNELSFSGLMNDSAYNFFPQLRINGPIERYNGELMWLKGRWATRGEYTQINEHRDSVGSEYVSGAGFESLPGVIGKGAYAQFTYLLTGEAEPENAIPKVLRPVIGPASPRVKNSRPGWGAWQLKFRYSWLEGRAAGATFDTPPTPTAVPAYSDHTDQISMGVNWYLNYWVLLKFDLNVDRLRDPSVQGILPQNYYVALQGLQFRF